VFTYLWTHLKFNRTAFLEKFYIDRSGFIYQNTRHGELPRTDECFSSLAHHY